MHLQQEFSTPEHVDATWRVGIVHSTYYKEENDALVTGAQQTLVQAGIDPANISLHPVLGSFEVPLIGAALAKEGAVDALMGFGIIVAGETQHDAHLAREVARGIMDVQLQYQLPFAYEVLHVETIEQARQRAGESENKGIEAAFAVLHSLAELARIQS